MSSLIQIEAAAANLPAEEQRSLLTWLEGHVASVPASPIPRARQSEALDAFRELQREVALTPQAAEAWKLAVTDARR
jgi:hypothetical protein